MTEPRKAVALISGGLDSMLAARLMRDQGIHVEGINFLTGFGYLHVLPEDIGEKYQEGDSIWRMGKLMHAPEHL